MQLIELLLTPKVLSVAAAIIALMYGLGKIPLKKGTLGKTKAWRKVAPIIPLALGVGSMMLMQEESIDQKIMTGLWAGFVAAHSRKVVKRLLIDKLGEEEK